MHLDASASRRFVEPEPRLAVANAPLGAPQHQAIPGAHAYPGARAADEVREPVFAKSVAREYFESMVVTFIMALFGMTFITQERHR